MAERTLRHDDLALAAHGVAESLRHRRAHELVVRGQEGMDVDLIEGAISVSMSMTGVPALIIFCTGWVRVPMPNAWMATKSHFCEAMLSMAARCFTASSWPSNQVTSTLKSLPQNSAACLPCAHQVACRPALENAAFNGFSDRPTASAASAGFMPMLPRIAVAAPAVAAACRRSRLVFEKSFVPDISRSHDFV